MKVFEKVIGFVKKRTPTKTLDLTFPIEKYGITAENIFGALEFTQSAIDTVDGALLSLGKAPLSQMIELTTLSSFIGNLMRGALESGSEGRFIANGPHKYPDLISTSEKYPDIELKVALEKNSPKGHLVKPGMYIVVRYVLCSEDGGYTPGKENRGTVPYIWEIRAGILTEEDFNVSNTVGDSGKTATVNSDGMAKLDMVYLDIERCPYTRHPFLSHAYTRD
jgi:hypothetical protein